MTRYQYTRDICVGLAAILIALFFLAVTPFQVTARSDDYGISGRTLPVLVAGALLVLGAYLSKGGKSFICCSSTFTTKSGEVKSRIVPTLAPGSIVTDTRANIHYLVTEYGKVNLKGLSTWQKAEAIISVAHPDFRDELVKQAEQNHIWRRSNK